MAWTQTTLKKEDQMDMSVFSTPETRLINLAYRVKDLFIEYDTSGDEIGNATPTALDVAPAARRLAQAVIESGGGGADGAATIANSLLYWLDASQQGRDYNVGSAARQLADEIIVAFVTPLVGSDDDDGLPF